MTKHGTPVVVAVPFDDALLESGVRVSLAVKLFDEGTLTLAQAAKFAGIGVETLIECAGAAGVTVVCTAAEELDVELGVIARQGRRRYRPAHRPGGLEQLRPLPHSFDAVLVPEAVFIECGASGDTRIALPRPIHASFIPARSNHASRNSTHTRTRAELDSRDG